MLDAVMDLLHPANHFDLWLDLLAASQTQEVMLEGTRQLQRACFNGLNDPLTCPLENHSWSLLLVDPVLQHFVRASPSSSLRILTDSWVLHLAAAPLAAPVGPWPPRAALAAERRLRAGARGAWAGEELYSHGAAACRIARSRRHPGVLVHDNCHGEDWESRRQGDWFHCPLNVPLAIMATSKSGSTATARWALQMDYPKGRDFALMASTWSPHAGSSKRRFLDPTNANEESLERLRRLAQPQRFGDDTLAVPRWSGLTCCRFGHGRLKVLVVRNPYARFISAYREMFLAHPGRGSAVAQGFLQRNSSVEFDFRSFLAFLATADFVHALHGPPDEQLRILFATGEGRWETTWMTRLELHSVKVHAGPVSELNRSGLWSEGLHLVHLERLQADLERLELRLCRELGYCRPLPPLLPANWGAKRRATARGTATGVLWRRALQVQQVRLLQRYQRDFELLGYSMDIGRLYEVGG
ncbi:unnamed protein product [Durusdinium trenchii]|uniref:Sulfotransferase domain-containing protein n=2 Tax=Durusdinium trenchii TaxID=1381693 RepID=A0ABP0HN61_9DINO